MPKFNEKHHREHRNAESTEKITYERLRDSGASHEYARRTSRETARQAHTILDRTGGTGADR